METLRMFVKREIRPAMAALFATLATLAVACSASRVEAQIIVNGSSVGTTSSRLTLSPVSGTGTLLVNANSSIAGNALAPGVNIVSSGFYSITNNGVMTNPGNTTSSQVVDMLPKGIGFSIVNNGTMSTPSSQ